MSCALAVLIALRSDPLSDSAASISCLVSPLAPLSAIDRSSAALTGERTTLPFGVFFWTAFSRRKPNALSAAAASAAARPIGGAACEVAREHARKSASSHVCDAWTYFTSIRAHGRLSWLGMLTALSHCAYTVNCADKQLVPRSVVSGYMDTASGRRVRALARTGPAS